MEEEILDYENDKSTLGKSKAGERSKRNNVRLIFLRRRRSKLQVNVVQQQQQ